MRSIKALCIATLCVITFNGCDGGGSCPFERPSCCDNALFGCGPFDLPTGCSCGDFLSRSFRGAPLKKRPQISKRTLSSTEGTWRITLSRTAGGCSYLRNKFNGTLLLRERNNQVSVKLIGFTTLRGQRVDKNVRARGTYRSLFPRCDADIRTTMNLATMTSGSVSSSITVSCANQSLSCSATYSGAAKKL